MNGCKLNMCLVVNVLLLPFERKLRVNVTFYWSKSQRCRTSVNGGVTFVNRATSVSGATFGKFLFAVLAQHCYPLQTSAFLK